ncbi:BrnA antitoxin family protein [Methylobacterium iners]|jgi:uncharacterized protein (DUF4415 family)|uniref:BrnA antitoxin family protein n=1 Tax=Methylobacterium iners TaxID=418707 RepID=A0ABQ4S2Y5_9HYPH|nr:BrnA antitoxin family protein [Methylobacterium iners]GJD96527.1 hypothetical protein OCOJLMKI_3748 [Methylobacterium iners]
MTKAKRLAPPITDEDEARTQAGIAADPDNPELTEEEFARMRPAREVLPPGVLDALTKRGRPKSAKPKVLLSLRIDREVVETFKATGAGWQTRMQITLARQAAKMKVAGTSTKALSPKGGGVRTEDVGRRGAGK